jgi:hypothetical protein
VWLNLYFYELQIKNVRMEKEIWLRVIREELGILEELATGMITDGRLTVEELELAIARSKIVTREFEMLYKQIPSDDGMGVTVAAKDHPAPTTEKLESGAETTTHVNDSIEFVVSVVNESPGIAPPQPEEKVVQPIPDSPLRNSSIPATPNPTDFEFPIPFVPEYTFPPIAAPAPEHEGAAVIDQEVKKEGHPLFKLSPIQSMKDGLTLNDRYLYQRELFNNDKARLDETILAMDRLSNIQEAVAYLKENFKWTRGEASEKFVLLVKRRFYEPKG